MSPVVNPQRFVKPDSVEESFSDLCQEVVGGECTAKERADYTASLLTAKNPGK